MFNDAINRSFGKDDWRMTTDCEQATGWRGTRVVLVACQTNITVDEHHRQR